MFSITNGENLVMNENLTHVLGVRVFCSRFSIITMYFCLMDGFYSLDFVCITLDFFFFIIMIFFLSLSSRFSLF
jgi:hypothetical protein